MLDYYVQRAIEAAAVASRRHIAHFSKFDIIHKTGSTQSIQTFPWLDRVTAASNKHTKFVEKFRPIMVLEFNIYHMVAMAMSLEESVKMDQIKTIHANTFHLVKRS